MDDTQLMPRVFWRQTELKTQVDEIMRVHDYGVFRQSAELVDQLMTDDRIYGTLQTRIDCLLSSPLSFGKRGDSPRLEQKIIDMLAPGGEGETEPNGLWFQMAPQSTLREAILWGLMLGVAVLQKVWTRTADAWVPRLVTWHPRALRWDWQNRWFKLLPQAGVEIDLPRPDREPRGTAEWMVWCPFGVEEGWRRALLRPLAMKYISRQWVERDWDRYCEKHGLAIIKGTVPPGLKDERRDFHRDLAGLMSDSVITCPQGETKDVPGFDVTLVEATAKTWETFQARKAALDTDIAIAVVGQNLTTEVKGGSLAATKEHRKIAEDKARFDASIGSVLREQLLSWWAEFNFGDPNLAPTPRYNIEPPDDELSAAAALKAFGEAGQALDAANSRTDLDTLWEMHGIPMLTPEEGAAKAAEAIQAAQDAMVGAGGGEGAPGGQAPPSGEGRKPGGPPAAKATALSAATTLALEKLASRSLRGKANRTAAGASRASKYQDALRKQGIRRAAAALSQDIAHLKVDIEHAQDFADLRRRLIGRLRGMDPHELSNILRRVSVMAQLSGQSQATEDVS